LFAGSWYRKDKPNATTKEVLRIPHVAFSLTDAMNTLTRPMLKDPGAAYGVISGFPVHDSYPLEDREELDKL